MSVHVGHIPRPKRNVQRPTSNVQRPTPKDEIAQLTRSLAARTKGVVYRDRRIARLEADLWAALQHVTKERLTKRPPLELLDDCIGQLQAETKIACSTALAYALTNLEPARQFLALDRRQRTENGEQRSDARDQKPVLRSRASGLFHT